MASKTSTKNDKDNISILPQGWTKTTLGMVSTDSQYGWTTKAKEKGSLHFLRTTDITSGIIDWESVPFCTDEPSQKEKYILKDGDIVISRAGSVGFSHLIKKPRYAVFASYLIRFKPLINESFFAYFVKSPAYWQAISEQSIGIAVQNVNASKLKQITIPLPPLPEQHRIVARIEELFTQLDAGVASLKKAQAQLKRYRQAVLKAAFEGRLTQEWREEHKGEIEPAIEIINRLDKKTVKRRSKERLASVKAICNFSVPNQWIQVQVNDVGEVQLGRQRAPEHHFGPDMRPYLRVANVFEIVLTLVT